MDRSVFILEGHRFVLKCFTDSVLTLLALQRVKEKFWFVRLSPNHRVLHYGDCDEKSGPALDELPNKLPVVDIRALVTGKDCPHMKDARSVLIRPELNTNLLSR